MKYTRIIAISAILAALLTAKSFGSINAGNIPTLSQVGTITSFSIGNARLKPIKQHPTAKDIYSAAAALYDSFDTIAASYIRSNSCVDTVSENENGEVISSHISKDSKNTELRYHKPDRVLIVSKKDEKNTLMIAYCKGLFSFYSSERPDIHPQDQVKPINCRQWVLEELGLLSDHRLVISKMRLLPDANVRGTKTYALELICSPRKPKVKLKAREHLISLRVTLYFGKDDLLLRKVVSSDTTSSIEPGLPEDTETWEFNGFQGNVELNDSLFKLYSDK